MKKIRNFGTSNSDNKDNDKKFTLGTEDCNCYLCREFKDQKRIIQRQNSFLSNIVAFEQ